MGKWTAAASSFSGVSMNIIKYLITVLIVLAIAEAIPEAVNAVLILILVGIVLMRFSKFESLANLIGTLGK